MSLTPDQLRIRRGGVTATDISSIVGVNPYRSAIDVWRDKMGEPESFIGNARTVWGQKIEPLIRADYQERHRIHVEVPGTLTNPLVAWWMFTPDGLCYPRGSSLPDRGLEIKVHNRDAIDFGRLRYGTPGSDEVPPHELIQCMWSIGGSGLDRWDLTVFDGAPTDYVIGRDDELIGILHDEAERFLIDYVKTKTPPPPDGSESYNRYLSTAFPQRLPDLVQLDGRPEAMAMVRHLRIARDQLAQVTTEVEIVTQNLKAIIGCHAGLEWTDPEAKSGKSRVTYKLSEEGSTTDWGAAWRSLVTEAQLALSADRYDVAQLAHALMEIADENRSISTYTATVPGSRRFYVPNFWNKKAA